MSKCLTKSDHRAIKKNRGGDREEWLNTDPAEAWSGTAGRVGRGLGVRGYVKTQHRGGRKQCGGERCSEAGGGEDGEHRCGASEGK